MPGYMTKEERVEFLAGAKVTWAEAVEASKPENHKKALVAKGKARAEAEKAAAAEEKAEAKAAAKEAKE